MGYIFKSALLIFFLITTFVGWSQERRPVFSEKGGLIGAGYGINAQNIPEGRYTPIYLIAHFGIDLVKVKEKDPQRFTLFFEPQINPVILQRPGKNGSSLEFGVNVGLQHSYFFTQRFAIYGLISTGPHYITVNSERQARGFIFSDNMGAGIYYFLSKNLAFNSGMRIRHISNANTHMPNHGINTMNFLMGLSFIIR